MHLFLLPAQVLFRLLVTIPPNALLRLKTGKAGMGDMHYLDSVHQTKLPVAEVKLSNEELAELAGLLRNNKPYCIIKC